MMRSSLVITLFAALLGLASCAAPVSSGVSAEYDPVTLTAEIVPETDPESVNLTVQSVVSNNSQSPITLTKLGFGGMIITGDDALWIASPFVFQAMTLTIQPGGRYVETFVLCPSFRRKEVGLSSGRHRMRFCYRRPGAVSFRPTVERQPNIVKDGAVLSLDSAEFGIVVK